MFISLCSFFNIYYKKEIFSCNYNSIFFFFYKFIKTNLKQYMYLSGGYLGFTIPKVQTRFDYIFAFNIAQANEFFFCRVQNLYFRNKILWPC